MFKKISTALASVTILTVISCATGPDVTVQGRKGGENFKVPLKKTIALQLEAQLGTGYSWKLMESPEILVLTKENIITEEQNKTGGTDLQQFIFRGIKKGKANLVFKYGEHWKKKPKFIKTYKASVTVE